MLQLVYTRKISLVFILVLVCIAITLYFTYKIMKKKILEFYRKLDKNEEIHIKNVIKGIELFTETENQDFIQISKIVKLPMLAIILVSAIIGSLYVSFAKGLTQQLQISNGLL